MASRAPRRSRSSCRRDLQEIAALEADLAAHLGILRRQQAHDGERRHALAAARFADQAQRAAALPATRSMPSTACTVPSSVAKLTARPLQFQQRCGHSAALAPAARLLSMLGVDQRRDRRCRPGSRASAGRRGSASSARGSPLRGAPARAAARHGRRPEGRARNIRRCRRSPAPPIACRACRRRPSRRPSGRRSGAAAARDRRARAARARSRRRPAARPACCRRPRNPRRSSGRTTARTRRRCGRRTGRRRPARGAGDARGRHRARSGCARRRRRRRRRGSA